MVFADEDKKTIAPRRFCAQISPSDNQAAESELSKVLRFVNVSEIGFSVKGCEILDTSLAVLRDAKVCSSIRHNTIPVSHRKAITITESLSNSIDFINRLLAYWQNMPQ